MPRSPDQLSLRTVSLAILLAAAFSTGLLTSSSVAGPAGGPVADSPARTTALAPAGRLLGFNEATFVHTGRTPRLDQGITPEQSAGDALAAGANSARMVVHWWELEPRPGQLNRSYLASLDRHIAALRRGGARPLLLLGGTPPWAVAPGGTPGKSPPSMRPEIRRAFARYAAFVARRWPTAVAIETWNEPNGRLTWAPRPDARSYLRVHRVAARAIRRARPGARVLLGGIWAVPHHTRDFVRGGTYVRQLQAAGLRRADYDGVALHIWTNPGAHERLRRDLGAFRADVDRGDPRAELWVTETGLSTTGPHPAGEAQQAGTLLQTLRLLYSSPRVRAVYVHTLYDQNWAPRTSTERGFGLLSHDGGRAKPAFCALNALARATVAHPGCPGAARTPRTPAR